uniref:LRAT domain-containing protein n=1 Tax=Panagrolaimus davidi TaxID=227884 RepID=A0A914P819_9BILA
MFSKTSDAMSASDLIEKELLYHGDMIQFGVPEGWGKIHHWAIYMGDGQIIHHTTHDNSFAFSQNSPNSKCRCVGIYEDSLVEYAKNQLVRKHNWADNGYQITYGIWPFLSYKHVYPTVRNPYDIVEVADEYYKGIRKIGTYHGLSNNCEIFATLCRYDVEKGFTGQTLGHGLRNSLWDPHP